MIKLFIRKIIPSRILFQRFALLNYYYDFKRFINFSSSYKVSSKINLESKIVMDCHTIEKGLTMPQTRFGFGFNVINRLINNCEMYISKYGNDQDQLIHTMSVLLEYIKFHDLHNFSLENNLIFKIKNLCTNFQDITPTSQIKITKDDYFSKINDPFSQFSKSRHSVRNFTNENINIDLISKSVELAQLTTPSACNRQTTRVYVYTNRTRISDILKFQSGNRGFGHLTNKLVVLTAELGVFDGLHERNQAYIDGGIFAMNILYSLHYYKIACCILNCSHDIQKDKLMREICEIKESEVFIGMIACGIPPTDFKLAISNRYNYLDFMKIIE